MIHTLFKSFLILHFSLQKKQKVQVKELVLESMYPDLDDSLVNVFVTASNLQEAVKQATHFKEGKRSFDANKTQSFKVEEKDITLQQVTRLWNRIQVSVAENK